MKWKIVNRIMKVTSIKKYKYYPHYTVSIIFFILVAMQCLENAYETEGISSSSGTDLFKIYLDASPDKKVHHLIIKKDFWSLPVC